MLLLVFNVSDMIIMSTESSIHLYYYMLNDCGYISGAFLLSVSDSDKVLTLHFQCHYMLTIVFEFRERSCSMLAFVTTYINCIFNTFIG